MALRTIYNMITIKRTLIGLSLAMAAMCMLVITQVMDDPTSKPIRNNVAAEHPSHRLLNHHFTGSTTDIEQANYKVEELEEEINKLKQRITELELQQWLNPVQSYGEQGQQPADFPASRGRRTSKVVHRIAPTAEVKLATSKNAWEPDRRQGETRKYEDQRKTEDQQLNSPASQGRSASRQPQKVIHRTVPTAEVKLATSENAWDPGYRHADTRKYKDQRKTQPSSPESQGRRTPRQPKRVIHTTAPTAEVKLANSENVWEPSHRHEETRKYEDQRKTEGEQPNYPASKGRRTSTEPKKAIHRTAPSSEMKLPTSENAWRPGYRQADARKYEDQSKTEEEQPNYPASKGRRTSTEPKKVIHRTAPSSEVKLPTSENVWDPGHRHEETRKYKDQRKTERSQGEQPNYPTSEGRRTPTELKKVIHITAPSSEVKLPTSENASKPGQGRKDMGNHEDQRKTKITGVEQNGDESFNQKVDERDFMTVQANINEHRRETVRKMCKKHPSLSRGPLSTDTLRHIYVNEQHKLLYCFIPKVGCSNWKRVMMILGGNTKNISDLTSTEVHENNRMRRLDSFPLSIRRRKLQSYTKFVYVRNPFARLLSAFNNKFGDVKQYRYRTYFHSFGRAIMKQFRPNATLAELRTGENITWTEFVKYLTQRWRPYFDDHWEEMYRLCSPCKLNYNYIGHLETVDSESKFMLKRLNLDSIVAYPSRENSHPTNSTAIYERSFRELPRENLQRLWEMYSIDFELFGYPKPNFVY